LRGVVGSAAQQLAHSKMADELATLAIKILNTEGRLAQLQGEIANLNKRLDDEDYTGTVRYSSQEKVEAALKDLTAEKAALQNKEIELLKEKNLLRQQQQQSGAGTSMLPIH
jgi:chromosome segregation ATPase